MDILTHTLSGIAVSTAVASLSEKPLMKKGWIIAAGATGAIMPDLDVITRWSGFDLTIGRWLRLGEPGRDIFFNTHWYSHRQFSHSMACALIVAVIAFCLACIIRSALRKDRKGISHLLRDLGVYPTAFVAGYAAHLLGDIPTPPSTWGGIKLFWPLDVSVGGSGKIWWFNNYDLFLIILVCCVVNIFLSAAHEVRKKKAVRYLPIVVTAFSFIVIWHQIESRPVNFASSGAQKDYSEHEEHSIRVQRDILDERVFDMMSRLDQTLKEKKVLF